MCPTQVNISWHILPKIQSKYTEMYIKCQWHNDGKELETVKETIFRLIIIT